MSPNNPNKLDNLDPSAPPDRRPSTPLNSGSSNLDEQSLVALHALSFSTRGFAATTSGLSRQATNEQVAAIIADALTIVRDANFENESDVERDQ